MAQKVSSAYTTLFDILKVAEATSVGTRSLNFNFIAHGAMQNLNFRLFLENGNIGTLTFTPYQDFEPTIKEDSLLTAQRSLTIVNAFMQQAPMFQPAALEAVSGIFGGLINLVHVDDFKLDYVYFSGRRGNQKPPKYNYVTLKGSLLENGKPIGRIELALEVVAKSDRQLHAEAIHQAMAKQAELNAAVEANDEPKIKQLTVELAGAKEALEEARP